MSVEGFCPHGEPFPGSTTDEHEIAFEEILDLIQEYHGEGRPDGGYKAARQFEAHRPDMLDTFLVAFLASEGTRIILEGDEETQSYAIYVAQVISAMEKRMYGNQCPADVEHENLFVFYKNRIPCECLDELVEVIEEMQEEDSEEEEEVKERASCSAPGCGRSRPRSELNTCAACQLVYYCNEECQRNHWPTHALTCIPADVTEENTSPADLGGSGEFSLSSLISEKSGDSKLSRRSHESHGSRLSSRSNGSRDSNEENDDTMVHSPKKSPKRPGPRPASPTKPKKQTRPPPVKESSKKKRKEKKPSTSANEARGKRSPKSKKDRVKGELSPGESPKKKKQVKVKKTVKRRTSPNTLAHEKSNKQVSHAEFIAEKPLSKVQLRRKSSGDENDVPGSAEGSSGFGHFSSPALFTDLDALAFLFDDSDSDDSQSPFDNELNQSVMSLLDMVGHHSGSSLGGSHGNKSDSSLGGINGNLSNSSFGGGGGAHGEKPLMTILEDSVNFSISAMNDLSPDYPDSPTSPLDTSKAPLVIEEEEHKSSPGTKKKHRKKSKRSSSKPHKSKSKKKKEKDKGKDSRDKCRSKSKKKKPSGKGEKKQSTVSQ